MATATLSRASSSAAGSARLANRARRRFLHFFPDGFADETYLEWERNYKWDAHQQWERELSQPQMRSMIREGRFAELAATAVRIESRTKHPMLFSFEKMALRDAVKTPTGARLFANGLYEFLHGPGELETKFSRWCEVVGALPRRQTRVLTWPLVTVFGWLAQPKVHIFLKPNAIKKAAQRYGYDFDYKSRPNWATYASLLDFAKTIRRHVRDLGPRDMIDIQSFMWAIGSDEYDGMM